MRSIVLNKAEDSEIYVNNIRSIFIQTAAVGQQYTKPEKGQYLLNRLFSFFLPFVMSIRDRREVDNKYLEFK